ncbi:MAG: energy-coupling factor ABC transporter ATP-binding protein, partial [Lentisphaerae bacterium RIFOXYA12_FULL_48_11]
MGDNYLALRDVTFGYEPDKPVIDNIELSIHSGEQVALVGRNGAGKTTLFHMFVGLLVPQKGKVEVLGQARGCERDFLEVRRHVALLFQNSEDQLFSPTVIEDVAFGPLNLGKSPTEAMALAAEALIRVGMAGYEERISHHLSAGEMKLVAL